MADLVVSSIGHPSAATADDYDLIDLDEAKTGLNIPLATTTYDGELALAITAVSQRIVELCGPVVNVTRTNETYDGGYGDIWLRNVPWSPTNTITVSSLAEYDTAGEATTLTAEDYDTKPADGYIVVPHEATILRRSSGCPYWFAPGVANVVVTYTTGRAANTAAVSAKFKEAAIITVGHVWTSLGARSNAARVNDVDGLPFGIPTFSLPKAAVDLLHGETVNQLGVG